jgi:hypothetical protein
MYAKRYLTILAIAFLSLAMIGCSKSEKWPSSDDQNSASQSGVNSAAGQTPSAATSGYASASTQGGADPAPAPFVIPDGTSITVRLQQGLSSASAVPGERFDAVVDEPVVLDNRTLLPVGIRVSGHVIIARRSGRLHHPGELGLTLDSVFVNNQEFQLNTSHIVVSGASHKKRNLGWIGGGTGGGAIIGALAGGGKGALIGGGIGAVAGTTTAFVTGKKDVGFAAEGRLRFRTKRDISPTA